MTEELKKAIDIMSEVQEDLAKSSIETIEYLKLSQKLSNAKIILNNLIKP